MRDALYNVGGMLRQIVIQGGRSSLRRTFAKRAAPLPPVMTRVERMIAEAQGAGDFDELEGKGKPLKRGHDVAVAGVSQSELIAHRAEFEMRRANVQHELDYVGGKGVPLPKGTTRGPSLGQISQYVKKNSGFSAKQLKRVGGDSGSATEEGLGSKGGS